MSEKLDFAKMYLQKASSKLESALTNLEHKQFDDSVSRAYYCIFHAISALIFLNELEFSSHSQTLVYFNREFIKTEIFPKKFGKWIYKLFEFRETGDYTINPNITENNAKEAYQLVSEILETISNYIDKNYS